MSGFEYAAAANMIQHGMVEQGLEIVREISMRYDGRLRAKGEVTLASNATVFGTGSPFGEDECGDYYARPLSSWSVLLALQGFMYNGPEKTIGFNPVWEADNHASFFSVSEGWGLFTQSYGESLQTSGIEVKYGSVQIKNVILKVPDNKSSDSVSVSCDGIKQLVESSEQEGELITIQLESDCKLRTGSVLKVSLNLIER